MGKRVAMAEGQKGCTRCRCWALVRNVVVDMAWPQSAAKDEGKQALLFIQCVHYVGSTHLANLFRVPPHLFTSPHAPFPPSVIML